ncbi:hypothetical protein DUNSADRAFT_495 [Dunaliella salina]|uniref:Encoded protein n=1 Tax=Dunaliella salina TaxID=3046 RepID=A0ABQ7FYV1_DUNSA|nr:hypothetical protein DUNSADRAFT_495 [Dunaliella salina]|eukprot:KAF5827526.1 hypothetical protein DUNSADRAFT_495 [Dunaliella salina]
MQVGIWQQVPQGLRGLAVTPKLATPTGLRGVIPGTPKPQAKLVGKDGLTKSLIGGGSTPGGNGGGRGGGSIRVASGELLLLHASRRSCCVCECFHAYTSSRSIRGLLLEEASW